MKSISSIAVYAKFVFARHARVLAVSVGVVCTALLPGPLRSQTWSACTNNSFIWASYFRRLNDQVTLAAEWSRWGFKNATFAGATFVGYNPGSTADVINVSVAYQF